MESLYSDRHALAGLVLLVFFTIRSLDSTRVSSPRRFWLIPLLMAGSTCALSRRVLDGDMLGIVIAAGATFAGLLLGALQAKHTKLIVSADGSGVQAAASLAGVLIYVAVAFGRILVLRHPNVPLVAKDAIEYMTSAATFLITAFHCARAALLHLRSSRLLGLRSSDRP